MDILAAILWPFKWVIEAILVTFHNLFTTIGLQADSGVTWVASIVGLVLVVRAALIPLFVKQIRSQRSMYVIQPDLQKIQKKYKKQPINTIDGVKIEFDNDWVHLRKSNTEPIIRIYAESDSINTAENLTRKILQDIGDLLN